MKALEKLFNKAIKNPDSDYCEITKCYEKVKSALERKEKLEKAWEIIKTKEVNTADFRESLLSFGMTYKHYLNNYKNYSWELLTETEFNDIVEILGEK